MQNLQWDTVSRINFFSMCDKNIASRETITSILWYVNHREIGIQTPVSSSLRDFLDIRDFVVDFDCHTIGENTDFELLLWEDSAVAESKQIERERLLEVKRQRRWKFLEERRERGAYYSNTTV